MTDPVADLMKLHHKAADARVKLLNLHHARLGLSQSDIDAKSDAESDLESALRAALHKERRETLEEAARYIDGGEGGFTTILAESIRALIDRKPKRE